MEDNSEDYIYYEEKRSNSYWIIKSVFRKLLGKYNVFEESEVARLEEEMGTLLKKYKQGLLDIIK